MNEDKTKVTDPSLPSENKTEVVPEVPQEPKNDEDIDFKKEAEALERRPLPQSKYTPAEKITYNLKRLKEQAEELGLDPLKVLGMKEENPQPREVDTSHYITREDMAEVEARKLASSEDHFRVIMWHYRNSIQKTGNFHEDIENANLLANKGKLKNVFEEIKRGSVKPPKGAGESSGQIVKTNQIPDLPPSVKNGYGFRKFKFIKPGLYQAKHNQYRYDDTYGWVSEPISK